MPRPRRRGVYATAREMEARCIQLRQRGQEISEIGQELGLSTSKVNGAIRRALSRTEALVDSEADNLKRIELRTLNELQSAVYGNAVGDTVRMVTYGDTEVPVKMVDYKAVEVVLKIQERRAKLLGLDAPKEFKADIKTTHGIDSQIEDLIRKRSTGGVVPGPEGLDGPRGQATAALAPTGKTVTVDSSGRLV